ncbi:gag-protease polyprotein [Cucumis melo var. makuwa]|uniref:Gag-protease polyprotein n=1 Tax=Cucumis melo var. makuwa TaxID=1194695 RepID=A0A5A7UN98_CUCMM|nr:gag-protease polyprotein [Cucumis melo var. makuwa]TYK13403.1 gag-protease polyprotein [Cucumis melo var. makuwa]
MLGGDVNQITWRHDCVEQYDVEFDMLSHFTPNVAGDEAARTKKNLRSEDVFQRHRQELATAGKTLRELPACRSCVRSHGGCCLAGSGVCYKYKQSRHIANFCPQKLLETSNHTLTSHPNKEEYFSILPF